MAVPPGVVTAIDVAPAAPAGVTAVICVSPVTTKLVAALPPKVTALAPVSAVPVIVTLVPPAVVPEPGVAPVMVGAAI